MTAPAREPASSPSVTLGALAWLGVSAVFIALRLGPTWQSPISGPEIPQLAGAWQARIGVVDDRFVPTLFQALTALLLHASTSEVPARVLAFVATATIPFALWLLRPALGELGALFALALLALEPVGLGLGSSASAMAFDPAITIWCFVCLTRGHIPGVLQSAAAFLLVTAGPIALPLVFAWAVLRLSARQYPPVRTAAWAVAGAVVGLLVASGRFGLGFDGLAVPPLDLFSAGFDQRWSTATTAEVLALYALPVILGGLLTAAQLVGSARRRPPSATEILLIAWLATALAWLLASLNSHNPAPVAAAALPAALLAGPGLYRAVTAAVCADWSTARFLVPGACFLALVAGAFVLTWARNESIGGTRDTLIVCSLLTLAAIALVVVASQREAMPALLVPALVIVAVPFAAPTFGVALSARYEPLLSPFVPDQAADLRTASLSSASVHAGLIVVHPQFADAVTWPFRDSGNIVISSRVPPAAAVVLWPADLPPPEGLAPLEGNWALEREVAAPTLDMLDYMHWLIDRQSVRVLPSALAVYTKGSQ